MGKGSGMKGCGKVSMTLIVIINVVFGLMGLAIFIAGMVLKFGAGLIADDVLPLLDSVQIGNTVSLGTFLNALDIVMIISGVIIMFISMLGCIGACCKLRVPLIIYAIIVIVLLLAEGVSVGLIIFYKAQTEAWLKAGIQSAIDSYEGESGGTLTNAFNELYYEMQCCGVDSFTDNDSGPYGSSKPVGELIPAFCCKNVNPKKQPITLPDATCKTNPSNSNSNFNTPCYPVMRDAILAYSVTFIVIGCVILFIEIIAIICAFCLCHAIGRSKRMLTV